MKMLCLTSVLVGLLSLGSVAGEPSSDRLYENDFSESTPGSVPDDFLVLDGDFEVREEEGNRFLELPGEPLDTFGVLFGPSKRDELAVGARIYGSNQGRRFPAFGVGLNGIGGYRMQISPAKRKVELYRNDQLVKAVDYRWKPETWYQFRLQLRQTGEEQWEVHGKVWPQGESKPTEWTIHYVDSQEPFPGRPSVWGIPYSGQPIRFDDLVVTPASKP